MAHSPTYWYDLMVAEKESQADLQDMQPLIDNSQQLLSDVSTSSKVGRWRLTIWVVAVAASAMEVVFDLFKSQLEVISLRSRFGTLPWYAYKSLAYQHGDSLVWQNDNYEYASINTANQIVKRVAAQEAGPTVTLKVAKLSGTDPVKLDPAELAGFEAYIAQIKPAGIVVNVISDDPDSLKLYLKVKYDPLVLDSSGGLLSAPSTKPVEDAVNSYISNLPFNGVFELCDLIDTIQDAEGVKSAYVTSAAAKYAAFPYSGFAERYIPNAGYLEIDGSFALSTTITYNA